MKYGEIYKKLIAEKIPLADIKTVFDGYFRMPFDFLLLHEEEECEDEKAEYAIARLKEGYPANYLAGYIDILHLHIFLNEHTLIPRTETEDFIYSYIKDHFDFSRKTILDLCTGSGIIAMLIKKIYPDSIVDASDISGEALEIANKSSIYNNLKINFIKSDFLNDINKKYDVIISNPPYIEEDNPDVDAPFEPGIALFSGKDGLDSYRAIFKELDSHLNENGIAFFETESTNIGNTINCLKDCCEDRFSVSVIKDCYDRDRYLEVRRK